MRQVARIGEGQQIGAISHRAALPPLLAFNLEPEDNFHQALHRAQQPLPFEETPVVDADLRFVASLHIKGLRKLRDWRRRAVGAVRELQRRWSGVTTHLRSFQEAGARSVTQQRDIGLLALLAIVTSGRTPRCPMVWSKGSQQLARPQNMGFSLVMDDVLEGWQEHNSQILKSLKPGKDDAFLLEQSMADATQGFCTPPLDRAQFLKVIQKQPHLLIPRCVITQSSGKQRVDRASGAQTPTS